MNFLEGINQVKPMILRCSLSFFYVFSSKNFQFHHFYYHMLCYEDQCPQDLVIKLCFLHPLIILSHQEGKCK